MSFCQSLISGLPFWFWLFRLHDLIPLGLFALICFLIGELARPFCRSFDWSDPSINHPFATAEMFPNWSLVLIVLCPVFVTALLVLFVIDDSAFVVGYAAVEGRSVEEGNGTEQRRPLMSLWHRRVSLAIAWTVAHCGAHALQAGTVELAKVFAGRLRPDFLSRLRRAGYNASSTGVDWCALGDDNKVVRDGRASFPSGHSSTAFAGFALFSLFLATQMRVVPSGSYGRLLLALLVWIFPFLVAISRTRDYRHNYDDIAVGGLIGVATAWLGYHIGFYWEMCPKPLTQPIGGTGATSSGGGPQCFLRPRYCYYERTAKKNEEEDVDGAGVPMAGAEIAVGTTAATGRSN